MDEFRTLRFVEEFGDLANEFLSALDGHGVKESLVVEDGFESQLTDVAVEFADLKDVLRDR
jgi:hypothetical protein